MNSEEMPTKRKNWKLPKLRPIVSTGCLDPCSLVRSIRTRLRRMDPVSLHPCSLDHMSSRPTRSRRLDLVSSSDKGQDVLINHFYVNPTYDDIDLSPESGVQPQYEDT
ncbi:hypothetical protein R1flu_014781 [Riccia fluitans]|uniref:Uncharacterized protein n=1 Tax=Riccia fluitans TaxID=41844 RepID=A0ABD1YHF1_9MARC